MPRTMWSRDLLDLTVITDACISPDASTVAYVLQRADLEQNTYSSAIFFVSTGEHVPEAPQQVTLGTHRDTSPRWSPDGRCLAFVSDRTGVPQLYLLDLKGGEPRQLTACTRGISAPTWSPDGAQLAFVSTEGNGIDDDLRNQPGGLIRHITRLQYRFDQAHYIDDRFHHIWTVDVANGTSRQLTLGDQNDLSPQWSPDGCTIAFIRTCRGEVDSRFRSHLCVRRVPQRDDEPLTLDGTDQSRCVSEGSEIALGPSWSPDGKRIAFIGRKRGARAGANNNVCVSSPDGTTSAQNLTSGFDRSLDRAPISDTWRTNDLMPLSWTPDSESIYFTAADRARVGLYRVGLGGNVERVQGGDRTIAYVSASADGQQLAYVAGEYTNPCDVYTCRSDGSHERRLTCINGQILADLAIQDPEALRFRSFDDQFDIDAWLVRPVRYEEGRQYPLVQIIHGGPHALFGHTFFFDMQLWANQGWNVLFVNPRGSQSYGEEFSVAINGDWGGSDWTEQEQALDLVIHRGGVDADRLAITGLSYGGFMTNWVIGHSNRYRAAVSENGLSNLISFYGTSGFGWYFLEHEMERDYWTSFDFYMERSPISYAPKIETPLLLLHAENDWSCPIEQSEQFYTAVSVHGVPCEIVRFPGESHLMQFNGKPESRLRRREQTLAWFQKYL